MPDFLKNITPTELQFVYYALLILISLGTIIVGVLGWLFGRQWLKDKALAALKSPWTAICLVRQMVNFPAVFAEHAKKNQERFDSIEYELKPNGNGSMRDAVNRIEGNQTVFSNKLRASDDRAAEALFEVQVNHLQPPISFIYVNPALCRMLGFPANHLLELNLLEKIEEAERKAFLGLWQFAIETGSPFSARTHIQHGGRGDLLHVKFVAQPQRDAAGRLCHYYGHLEPATRSNA